MSRLVSLSLSLSRSLSIRFKMITRPLSKEFSWYILLFLLSIIIGTLHLLYINPNNLGTPSSSTLLSLSLSLSGYMCMSISWHRSARRRSSTPRMWVKPSSAPVDSSGTSALGPGQRKRNATSGIYQLSNLYNPLWKKPSLNLCYYKNNPGSSLSFTGQVWR